MKIDEAHGLFGYCSWANARVFAAAGELPAEEVDATVASSFPSLRKTLAHIVASEWVWLRRWLGEGPNAPPPWASEGSLGELRDRLAAVEAERAGYLSSLADADLERVVAYRTLAGEPHSEALSGQIRHVVNHSSYHRGQVATQLRQLGRTPPNTDLITFLRQGT